MAGGGLLPARFSCLLHTGGSLCGKVFLPDMVDVPVTAYAFTDSPSFSGEAMFPSGNVSLNFSIFSASGS